MECPDDVSVAAWLDGSAGAEQRADIDRHLDSCDSCRTLFADVVRATRAGRPLGRFVVDRLLGTGAMGEVYAAHDGQLGRRIALKLPRGAGHTERLLREARAMAQISHPAVVAIHEVGTVEDVPYIVMEHVDGVDLATWRAEAKRSHAEVVAVIARVALGLEEVHRAGLVHRDVKPSNILIDRQGRVRLGDFGLAGVEEAGAGPVAALDDLHVTRTGELVGTPAYMAPELLRGERATAASDQFALCVVLYELLCGQRPFAGETLAELTANVLAGTVRTPVRVRGSLMRVVRRGLAVEPTARFPSLAALADALRPRLYTHRRAASIGLALAGLAAVAGAMWWPRAAADPCAGETDELAAIWNPARRAQLVGAFGASPHAYAPDTAARVTATFDRYVTALGDAQRAACTTRDPGAERRTACLAERRRRLDALASVLTAPTPEIIEHASAAALALPPVADCDDARRLVDTTPDPVRRAILLPLSQQVAALEARRDVGDYRGVVAAAPALIALVTKQDAPALTMRALGVAALARMRTGDLAGAEAALRIALDQAARAHADDDVVRVWSMLMFVVVLQHRPAEAIAMAEPARLALVRAGGDPEAEAQLDTNLGAAQRMSGDLAGARSSLERALALDEQLYGKDSIESATPLTNYANVLTVQGHYAEALAIDRRLLAMRAHAHGANHPDTAHARANLAALLDSTGDHEGAVREGRAALAVLEPAWGAGNPMVLTLWNNLGFALANAHQPLEARHAFEHAAAGAAHSPVLAADALDGLAKLELEHDPPRAADLLRRSLALREASEGPTNPDLGATLTNLGQALAAQHACRDALPIYDRAITILRQLGPNHPNLAQAVAARAACR